MVDGIRDSSNIERSQNVWYSDGNIVIRAENTLFRIYRGILEAHSPFFRDLFNLPQPAEPEIYDGCSLVLMHDCATDAEHFLRALHDCLYLNNDTPDRDVLLSCLRLATKYDAVHLRRRLIHRAEYLYPVTFKDFCRAYPPRDRDASEQFLLLDAISELNLPDRFLPSAIYNCVALPLADIIDAGSASPRFRQVLIARQRLSRFEEWESMSFLKSGVLPFTHRCAQSCYKWLSTLLFNNDDTYYPDPLRENWDGLYDGNLCDDCHADARAMFKDAKEKCWEELPAYCDLQPWKELMDKEDEEMST